MLYGLFRTNLLPQPHQNDLNAFLYVEVNTKNHKLVHPCHIYSKSIFVSQKITNLYTRVILYPKRNFSIYLDHIEFLMVCRGGEPVLFKTSRERRSNYKLRFSNSVVCGRGLATASLKFKFASLNVPPRQQNLREEHTRMGFFFL